MNRIFLKGRLMKPLELDHVVGDEKVYKGMLSIPRLSGELDTLPFLVSERKLGSTYPNEPGASVSFEGQLRTHNALNNRLLIYGFVQRPASTENPNQVQLTGVVCKAPTHRMTPLGRVITDLMLAVPRAYDKRDYIPCVTWGDTARFASHLKVGDRVTLLGRFQSRDYQKQLSDVHMNSAPPWRYRYSSFVSCTMIPILCSRI
ncbi:MAG: single-stranded DNA-binding protein [Bacteroidaceae bacterium]|nr:single-stranded DNA-binding protein [Bacteroidaceae bacterium]